MLNHYMKTEMKFVDYFVSRVKHYFNIYDMDQAGTSTETCSKSFRNQLIFLFVQTSEFIN